MVTPKSGTMLNSSLYSEGLAQTCYWKMIKLTDHHHLLSPCHASDTTPGNSFGLSSSLLCTQVHRVHSMHNG